VTRGAFPKVPFHLPLRRADTRNPILNAKRKNEISSI
jgi:hypothetical protein